MIAYAIRQHRRPARVCYDGVGHHIAGQHPSAFVVADRKTARDMRQRDVGDSRVEQFHEWSECDDDGDDPLMGHLTCVDAPRDRSVVSNIWYNAISDQLVAELVGET